MRISLKTTFWNKNQTEWPEAYANLAKTTGFIVALNLLYLIATRTTGLADSTFDAIQTISLIAITIYCTLIYATYKLYQKQQHNN